VLTVAYLACLQGGAWPAIAKVLRRQSADDLSLWREALIIMGCGCQLAVMLLTGADWRVMLSPIGSIGSVSVLIVVVWKIRGGR